MENDISTWDPMKEDFFDPNFNSYCQGPGAKLDRKLQPCFSRTDKERPVFRLHISNISAGLNEEGIKNVFLHFGNPFDIYRQPAGGGPGWAMVSYATHREAELAIRKLNHLPPFYFKVHFARSPEEKERIRQEKAKGELLNNVLENEPYPIFQSTTKTTMAGLGRGRALPFRHQLSDKRPGNLQFGKNLPNDEYVGFYSPFAPGTHYETNRIIMQNIDISIKSPMGTCRVSGGRGYSLVSAKTIDQDLKIHNKNVMYDRIVNGMYEKGTMSFIGLSGKCLYCHKLTKWYCQQCHGWYCTRECQVADWSDHKSICLVEVSKKEETDLTAHSGAQGRKFSSKSIGKMSESLKLNVKTRFPYLSLDTFTCVKVTVQVNSRECWAQFVDHESELTNLLTVLNDGETHNGVTVVEPNMLCAGLFENLWFRAKVICLEPELKVLYIDYGNEEICSIDKLKSIPVSLKEIPPMALKIKIAEENSGKYKLCEKEILRVKPVDMQDDAVVVLVEGEVYDDLLDDNELNSSEQLKECNSSREKYNTIDDNNTQKEMIALANVTPGMMGGCLLQQKLINGDIAATIACPSLKSELLLLDQELRFFKPDDDHYSPRVGEMVVVKSAFDVSAGGKEVWLRGYVLAIGSVSYRVNLCDVGRVVTVSRVQRLPEDLKQIPEFAVRCILTKSKDNEIHELLKENDKFIFTVVSVDDNKLSVKCILKTGRGEEISEAILKPWVPSAEDEGLKTVLLNDQDKVILTVFYDQTALFVRPAGENDKEVFSKIQQDVCYHCITTTMLSDIPHKNDIVACKFEEDGNYYRAQVLKVEEDIVTVAFIDFGNQISVEKSRLKPLTDDLKKIPAMAVKVMLNNVKDRPLTKSIGEFMSHLIGEQVELTLTKSNSFSNDVELFLPNGESLNNKVNTFFDLESNKLRECKIYKECDIQFLELPLNETIDFAVLHKLDSVTFMGCDANGGDIVDYVFGGMLANLNDYCESTPDEPYLPRISELCFAKSTTNGHWYRAVCIGDGLTRENNILFLDFGNMEFVDMANIRRMTPEFAEIPGVAVLCTLKDLTSESATEDQKKKINELVQINEIYKANVVESGEQGTYVIEFPHVTELLTKEGLLD
ncbi:hypothetical protein C0J52_09564 [Blattella germanica]|nr:hypothetical protein C0J52_09564 [Blattella germanica]